MAKNVRTNSNCLGRISEQWNCAKTRLDRVAGDPDRCLGAGKALATPSLSTQHSRADKQAGTWLASSSDRSIPATHHCQSSSNAQVKQAECPESPGTAGILVHSVPHSGIRATGAGRMETGADNRRRLELSAGATESEAIFARKLAHLSHADSSSAGGSDGSGGSSPALDSGEEAKLKVQERGVADPDHRGSSASDETTAGSEPQCRSWCGHRCGESERPNRQGLQQQQQQQQQQQSKMSASADSADHRLRVCQEIVATERRYCCCLRIIIDLLAQTVKASACISVKNLCLIFPRSLPRLHELHSAFLHRLESRLQSQTASDNFSGALLHFLDSNGAELLRLYRDYANDYRCALATLRKCQARSARLRRLLRCLQRHPSCQGLDLPAYLLTPVQRTPRYLLLLAQLRAHTPAGHPDLSDLTRAVELLRQLLDSLDVSIHSALKQPHLHQHQLQQQQQQQQPDHCSQVLYAENSQRHQSRKSAPQPSQPLIAGSCDSLHRLGRFVRRRAGSCDTGSLQQQQQQQQLIQPHHHHHFLGGGQKLPGPAASATPFAGGATAGRMGPRSRAISRQLRSGDRSHSAGDILRQGVPVRLSNGGTATSGADVLSGVGDGSCLPPAEAFPPAPLATWEEPQAPPAHPAARRRAKSTSARPAMAIKESLRRVFLQPRRKSSITDLSNRFGTEL